MGSRRRSKRLEALNVGVVSQSMRVEFDGMNSKEEEEREEEEEDDTDMDQTPEAEVKEESLSQEPQQPVQNRHHPQSPSSSDQETETAQTLSLSPPNHNNQQNSRSIPENLQSLYSRNAIRDFRSENPLVYANARLPAIHLGDIYNSRYRIVLKIGHGSYSTVWLAVDLQADMRHVALKFLTASQEAEGRMHKFVSMSMAGFEDEYDLEAGREHVMEMLDSFQITRNERSYVVLVSEVLMPLQSLYQPPFKRRGEDTKRDFYQIAKGLAFLHHRGITHGDLWYANLACRLQTTPHGFKSLSTLPLSNMLPLIPSSSSETKFKTYPKYLVSNDIFRESYVEMQLKHAQKTGELSDASCQIIDLSNSYIKYRDHAPAMKIDVRAPEFSAALLVFDLGFEIGGFSADIWALACTMFNLVYQNRPFLFHHADKPNFYLWEIERKIGPIPQSWNLETRPHGGPVGSALTNLTPEKFWKGLHDIIHPGPGPSWVDGFLKLLRKMLAIDPRERVTIDEVLNDEWFDDVRESSEELEGDGYY